MARRSHAYWTTGELQRLKQLYPITPTAELVREFPRHSRSSVLHMARRHELWRPLVLSGQRDWAAIAAAHVPVFNFPTK